MTSLENSYAHHDTDVDYIDVDPIFDPLHGESRFQELLKTRALSRIAHRRCAIEAPGLSLTRDRRGVLPSVESCAFLTAHPCLEAFLCQRLEAFPCQRDGAGAT